MAFDAFLWFDSLVIGQTLDKEMSANKAMDIYSFSLGASNPTSVTATGSGLSAGKVSISSFNFMKKTDSASPIMFQCCAGGQHFATVNVALRKAAGNDATKITFLSYTFTSCMIESIQWSGSSGGDDTPTESVSIAFAQLQISFQKQNDKGAKDGAAITGGWNSQTGQKA